MQLEWRALRRAVESSGSARAEAIADALAFRRERRGRFPGAADNERRDEIREGPATYTGIAAWANSPADAHHAAATALAGGEAQASSLEISKPRPAPPTVLLDDLLPGWRRECSSTISPFPRDGAISTRTTAFCALPMEPRCPYR